MEFLLKIGGRIRDQALRDCTEEEEQGNDESFKTGRGSSASLCLRLDHFSPPERQAAPPHGGTVKFPSLSLSLSLFPCHCEAGNVYGDRWLPGQPKRRDQLQPAPASRFLFHFFSSRFTNMNPILIFCHVYHHFSLLNSTRSFIGFRCVSLTSILKKFDTLVTAAWLYRQLYLQRVCVVFCLQIAHQSERNICFFRILYSLQHVSANTAHLPALHRI